MPKVCSVCALAEHRSTVDALLRAGTPQVEIAQQYGFSVDSVQRHVARHLNRPVIKANDSRLAMLQSRWERVNALCETALAKGDDRLADSLLGKLQRIEESMDKCQAQAASGFETMTLSEKVEYIKRDNKLHVALFDDLIKAYDALPKTPILCSACSQPILSD